MFLRILTQRKQLNMSWRAQGKPGWQRCVYIVHNSLMGFLVKHGIYDFEQRLKHCFIKIALKRCLAQELNGQIRRTDKRPQDPAELAAQKKIAGEPGT